MSFEANESGICPHCRTGVRFETPTVQIREYKQPVGAIKISAPERFWFQLEAASCPTCGKIVLSVPYVFESGSRNSGPGLLYPRGTGRPLPPDVHAAAPNLARDFAEAVAVLPSSRKASAALSRRCLQFILTNAATAKKRDLADQIDEVLPSLPRQLGENVDAIRHIGNFAAHPLKSTSTGTIVDVEDGEAEWLLDVLEGMIDHYYVAPARSAAKRAALNKKLQDIGKPPIKQP